MSKVIAYFKANKLHLVMWTIFLSLVITLYVSTTRASYRNDYGGSGRIPVAKFEIITQSNNQNKVIKLTKEITSDSYSFSIKSESDIDVSYDILITFQTTETPDCMSVVLDETHQSINVGSNRLLFENIGTILHTDNELRNHTLTFSLIREEFNLLGEEIEINDILIQVISTQII